MQIVQIAVVKGNQRGIGRQFLTAIKVSTDLVDTHNLEVLPEDLQLRVKGLGSYVHDAPVKLVDFRQVEYSMVGEHREVRTADHGA